jgi:hypothetical protein
MPFHSSFVIKQLVHLLAVEMVFVYFVAKVKSISTITICNFPKGFLPSQIMTSIQTTSKYFEGSFQ